MGSRRVVFEDLMRMRTLSDPQLSPDGRRVAFVVTEFEAKEDRALSRIWVLEADGSARPLTSGGRDTAPRWSPDQSRLAFLSARGDDKEPQLHILPTGGGEARAVTRGLLGAAAPAWSPSGDRIALTTWRATPESDMEDLLRALHWDGDLEEDVLRGRPHDPPRRDPGELASEDQARSGLRITRRLKYRFDAIGYFDGRRRHLVLADPDAADPAEAEALTHGEYDIVAFAWHPDGERIAFVANREADQDEGVRQDLWEVRVQGRETTRLAQGMGSLASLAWSPDGATLAVIGDDAGHGVATDTTLFVLDDGRLVDVTAAFDRPVGSSVGSDLAGAAQVPPVWTADGTGVLFTAVDHGSAALYRAQVMGARPAPVERLTADGLRGGIHEFSASAGRVVGIVSGPTLPPELADLEAGLLPRPVSRLNADLAAELDLVDAERLVFTAPDGLEIEGWLMRPPGTPAGAVPLILSIHGGPHGTHGLGFRLQWQAHAALGRAALFVNPRGSTGYGQAFTEACLNDWGGRDFEDLMAGVDAAIACGGIDPRRLVVTGISYGGFMTSWTIGHTDRFACAIPEMLVGNLVSFYGTSDIGTWFIPAEVSGDPFGGLERAWKHSPLAYLENARTPTLVIEGEADHRCPIEQGEQIYAALRRRGVEAALLRVPDASHGFSQAAKPSIRLRRQRLMAAWMDRYAPA